MPSASLLEFYPPVRNVVFRPTSIRCCGDPQQTGGLHQCAAYAAEVASEAIPIDCLRVVASEVAPEWRN